MAAFVEVALLLALYVWIVVAAGCALSHAVGLRARYWTDLAVAVPGLGLAGCGAAVFTLLLAHAYHPGVPQAGVAALTAYVAWLFRRGLPECLRPEAGRETGLELSAMDMAVGGLCALRIGVGLVEAATSPLTAWDAVVSWDKWATEWATRSDISGRMLGYYPQLLPMASSILYKLTGTGHEPIPLTQYALHAFQPLLTAMVALAAVRVCRLFEIPAWPPLVAIFGLTSFRAHIADGSADMMAVALAASSLLVLVSAMRGDLQARRGVGWLAGAVLFGAFFTKTNNLTLLAAAGTAWLLPGGEGAGGKRFRGILLGAVAALAAFGTYPLHQYLNADTPADQVAFSDLNFNPSVMRGVLTLTTELSVGKRTGWEKAHYLLVGLSEDYAFPSPVLLAVLAVAGLAGALRRRATWPLLAMGGVHTAIWYVLAAYDRRNLMPALVPGAVAVTAGLWEIWRVLGKPGKVRVPAAAPAVLFAAVVVGGVGREAITGGAEKLRQLQWRFAAMSGNFLARAEAFYPQEMPTYRLLEEIGALRRAEHIMAGSRMYRWTPHGAYTVSYWPREKNVPGDVFVSLEADTPPAFDRWTKAYDDGYQRVYLFDREPVAMPAAELAAFGAAPPRIVAGAGKEFALEATGSGGHLAYRLPAGKQEEGMVWTWRVEVAGEKLEAGEFAAAYGCSAGAPAEGPSPRMTLDKSRAAEGMIVYSGLLAISGKGGGCAAGSGAWIGLETRAAGKRVTVREFRMARYR